jgi:hypothetical protein
MVYGNFNHSYSPLRREKPNYILFTAKGKVSRAERPAHAPTAHVVAETLI